VRHMGIAVALIRFYFRLIPRGWYRKAPFLPLPPPLYIKWRLRTAYGQWQPSRLSMLRDLWQFGDWLRTFDKY
jgi:hypothetical protein